MRLRRSIVILVDSGRAPSGDWVQKVEGPSGTELIMAAADTAVQASVRASYTAFERIMADWQRQLIAWRCGLSAEQRKRYGAPANWNCRDLKFFVNRVGFDQLGPERAKVLNAVDTRLKLPADQVDAVIAAGRDALRVNPTFRDFLKGMGRAAPLPAAGAGGAAVDPGRGCAGRVLRPRSRRRSSALSESSLPTAARAARLQAVLLDHWSRRRRGQELLQRPGFGLRLGSSVHAA